MWEAISAITGLATLLVMIFIEWPRIWERWQGSISIIRQVFSIAYFVFVVTGFVLYQIGIRPGKQLSILSDDVLGQIGLWIFTPLVTLWVFNMTRKNFAYIRKDIITLLALIALALSLYMNVWMYYYSNLSR